MLIFVFIIGNSILLYVQPVIQAVRQDAWISCLIAVVPAMIATVIAAKAGLFNPASSFLGNCRRLLGKWPGTVVVLIYLSHWLTAVGSIVKYATDFIVILLLPNTPNIAFFVSLLVVAVYAVMAGGIESLGKLGEVFGLICIISLLAIFLMLIPSIQWQNLLPVYVDNGWLAIVRASIYPMAFKAEVAWIVAVIPFLAKPEKAVRTALWSLAAVSLFGTVTLLFVIWVLSPEVAALQLYPTFDTNSFISIMNFIQNLEIVLMVIWLLSVFLRMCLYMFLAAHTSAELFGMRKWHRMIGVVAIWALIQAWVMLTFKIDVLPILSNTFLTYIFPVTLVILPLLLLITGWIRQMIGRMRQREPDAG